MILEAAERFELIALLREVSPQGFAPDPGLPPPWIADLKNAPLPRPPKAVLFDLYGTLLASAAGGEPGLTSAGSKAEGEGALAKRRLEDELPAAGCGMGAATFAEEVAHRIAERRDRALVRHPFPEIDIEEIVGSLILGAGAAAIRRLALLHEAWRNPCAPMPGASALLRRLRMKGLRLGIVSNAQFYTPLLFEALFGAAPAESGMETILTIYSFKTGIAKPDPALFVRAAAPLFAAGFEPGDILVVGNSTTNDIAPAASLGFMTALFAGDERSFRPARRDAGARPDTLIDSLQALDASFPED
ncbi:MAG TPA: HAD family hydrolase [Rectinemataceae bacterium]|nr:HAD family hydrolase [Rectinemataceae bacterium]